MKKNLKYFMHSQEPEIVSFPGPESFVDENGNVLQFEARVLPQGDINKINDAYRRRTMATDKRGNPIVSNGEVVWKTDRDNAKASRHIVVESLVYPDLKDKELMEYYHCVDITDMPLHVFPRMDDYLYVLDKVMQILGITSDVGGVDADDVDEAKN